MKKQGVFNLRYPHIVRVVRRSYGDGDWLSENQEATEKDVYFGPGRCYTSGSVEGQQVDNTHPCISIPVNTNEWGELYPSSGDTVTVTIGEVTETMEVKDFEPDNNRSVLYCRRNKNSDL